MTFAVKDWKDDPDPSTPISAEALEDMETRLSDYTDDLLDTANAFTIKQRVDVATAATEAFGVRVSGDTQDSITVRPDKILFGPGGSTAPDMSLSRHSSGFMEWDTGTGKVRMGDLPDLRDTRTGIMFTSDDSNWVGFEHETNLHLNAYGSFFHIRTSTSAFNVCAGDASGGATSTYFSVDTTNGIAFVNGKLQFGSLSGSDTALERNAAGRVGTVSGVSFLTNTADLYAQAVSGASAVRMGAIGPSSQAGILLGDDSGFYRSAANTVKTDDALVVDSSIQSNGVVILTNTATSGYIEAREQSADPSAPSADRGRLYFKDNGAGKTQLAVRFATGAVQILATEP